MNRRSFGVSLNTNKMTAILDTSDFDLSDLSASDSEYIPNSDA